jgi:tRNA A37 threonylcarbamoyladenosine modification protein TsaB
VAACYDAQRGQLFGAAYEREERAPEVKQIIEEVVIAPEEFVELVDSQASARAVTWITLDPSMIEKEERLLHRIARGDRMVQSPRELASSIGKLAQERAARREFSDPMALDANYVRRSDAEIFWKGTSAGVR